MAGSADELVRAGDAVRVVLPAADPARAVLHRTDDPLPVHRLVHGSPDLLAAEADAALRAELALLPDPVGINSCCQKVNTC